MHRASSSGPSAFLVAGIRPLAESEAGSSFERHELDDPEPVLLVAPASLAPIVIEYFDTAVRSPICD
jgi:hypothetical protein